MHARSQLIRPLGLIAWLTVLFGCAGDGPLGPSDPVLDAEIGSFVQLVNEHRTSVGCSPLSWSAAVAEVAQAHSADMIERGFFSHTNPDGEDPGDRLANAGIQATGWAENIAAGYSTAQSALEGWLGSPGHRANLENCSLTGHGVGLVDQHWTHLFLRP